MSLPALDVARVHVLGLAGDGAERGDERLDRVLGARETKHMDPSRYLQGGNDITDAFKAYAAPLVGKLPTVGSFDEL